MLPAATLAPAVGSGDIVSRQQCRRGAFIGFDVGSVEVGILLEALETKGVCARWPSRT